jgi:hypothetical protein
MRQRTLQKASLPRWLGITVYISHRLFVDLSRQQNRLGDFAH